MSSNKEHEGKREMYDEEFSLDETLQSLDKKELYDLVENLVERNQEVYRLILEWLKGKSKDLKDIDSKKVGILLNDGLLMEYWYNAEDIISDFNEYGGGPEEDEMEACDWLDKISELIKKGNISTEAKFEFLDAAFVEYDEGNSGFEDALKDLFFEICETKEEWEYLVKKLEKWPSRWRNEKIMDIQKDHLCDGKAYLKLRMESLQYGMDYWDLVDFYQKQGDTQKALETAEQGILKGDGRCTELFEFLFEYFAKKQDTANLERIVGTALSQKTEEKDMLDRLFEYYKSQGDYEKAKEKLLKAYEFVKYGNYYEEYKKMKEFLKESDWKLIEPEIIKDSKKENTKEYLQICLDKNMKKTVLDTLLEKALNPPRSRLGFVMHDTFDEFADLLKEDFPEEIIEYYWQKAYSNIPGGTRGTYHTAATYLNKIKHIYIDILQNEPQWNQRFTDLKIEFKKRPAFLEEIQIVEGIKDSDEWDY